MTPETPNPNIDFDLLRLREIEHARIEAEVLLERGWWADKVIIDANEVFEKGVLVNVANNGDYYCLVSKLRNNEEPRVLRKEAQIFLENLADEWGKTVENQGLASPRARLAVISLFRTSELQEQLRAYTHRATRGISSHAAGAAIDFDPSSYYLGEEKTAIRHGDSNFNSKYISIFKDLLHRLEEEGQCHVIYELDFRKLQTKQFRYMRLVIMFVSLLISSHDLLR